MAEPTAPAGPATPTATDNVDAVDGEPGAEGTSGTYELLRDRLHGHAAELGRRAGALNETRLDLFGSSELVLAGAERIHTEHNCVARDAVHVGGYLLFGFNASSPLKTSTSVADVFSLHRLAGGASADSSGATTEPGGYSLTHVTDDDPGNFLTEPDFVADFVELHRIFRDARLVDLRVSAGKLLAVFRTGDTEADIRAFRWAVSTDGTVTYIDDRGERDYTFPPKFDFSWVDTTRQDHVAGRWPHISIVDEVFVDTTGGTLQLRVDDGSDAGRVVFSEPVQDPNQALTDAAVAYARLGAVIVVRVRPYRETVERFIVFNARTRTAVRIDEIGQSCQTLPEDHGIIFPGGFYLQSGDTKTFDLPGDGFEFEELTRSPNGEDVLYHFHRRDTGLSLLLAYNMVRREVAAPMPANGVSLFDDGTLVLFRDPAGEPTRVHQMQVWKTPFVSDTFHAATPPPDGYLARIGNAELVKGISDALAIRHLVESSTPSMRVYEDLIGAASRAADAYHWYTHDDAAGLGAALTDVRATAELIVDEFEKVTAAKARATTELETVTRDVRDVLDAAVRDLDSVEQFSSALSALRSARGRLATLTEVRYIDTDAVAALDARVADAFAALSGRTVDFLAEPEAFTPFQDQIAKLTVSASTIERVVDAGPVTAEIDRLATELEVLTEVVAGLDVDDATVRTVILESISSTLASLNQAKAILEGRRADLTRSESSAAFAAEFALFAQSVTAALTAATTPDRCDEQLGRLMTALEGLESNYGATGDYLDQITTKREDIYEAFTARKQSLVDERAAKASRMVDAARRILTSVARRAATFESAEDLAGFFAADPMVTRVRGIVGELRDLGEPVAADELDGALSAARTDAGRVLRDRTEMFESGGEVIRLGRHRFSVNTHPVEMTMAPSGDRMELLVTGTDFRMPVTDESFETTREYWNQLLVSETSDVYRAEYLAYLVLTDAASTVDGVTDLAESSRSEIEAYVRRVAEGRYDEGYERGVHDHDAARIVGAVASLWDPAGLVRFPGTARTVAAQWAATADPDVVARFRARAAGTDMLNDTFGAHGSHDDLAAEIAAAIEADVEAPAGLAVEAGEYLAGELAGTGSFAVTEAGVDAHDDFVTYLDTHDGADRFAAALDALSDRPAAARALARSAIDAFAADGHMDPDLVDEVVGLVVAPDLERRSVDVNLSVTVPGLLGQHPRITERSLPVRLDEFCARLGRFTRERIPGYRAYQAQRHQLLAAARDDLRLDDYMPKVMSAFVRNQLINDVYLPLIGDNLAKQIGTVGEGRRTDQMGLLMLISPPGYGKTTLMEYVAARLGMVFVKVSGPALGHGVTSLDPAEAPNATSRAEVERINFAFEAGNNVCLYLDDIQHTHPELLQKFISLADGTRRAEGVWDGEARTYDLRGKRFAICMAGNPYTESGETFRVPDMLANRADTYNLGDVIGGNRDLFALSYIENALSSNTTLAPLASRDRSDLTRLIRMADGEAVQADELSHPYDKSELADIVAVLAKLRRVQQVLLAVNEAYIASASQADEYRTEPPFGLQGSYRNMARLAEKVVPVMDDTELDVLLDSHYAGESQTLTTGAEANLLKLAELRGTMTDTQRERWDEIRAGFRRRQVAGSTEDPMDRVAAQIALLGESLTQRSGGGDMTGALVALEETLRRLVEGTTTGPS